MLKSFFFVSIQKNKGVAMLEFCIAFLVFSLFLLLLYTSWGVMHAGILNSISARAYAFSVIRNRSSLLLYKDANTDSSELIKDYSKKGARFFAITTHQNEDTFEFKPQKVSIDFLYDSESSALSHLKNQQGAIGMELNREINNTSTQKTNRIYLKQGYGICLNAQCGDL